MLRILIPVYGRCEWRQSAEMAFRELGVPSVPTWQQHSECLRRLALNRLLHNITPEKRVEYVVGIVNVVGDAYTSGMILNIISKIYNV